MSLKRVNKLISFSKTLKPDFVKHIQTTNNVLNIEYDQIKNDVPVHVEYELVAQGNKDSFVSDIIYKKMLDSLLDYVNYMINKKFRINQTDTKDLIVKILENIKAGTSTVTNNKKTITFTPQIRI